MSWCSTRVAGSITARPPLAITDDDLSRTRIDPGIVGIAFQIQDTQLGEVAAAIKMHGPVIGICDNDRIGSRDIGNALWRLESANPVEASPRGKVDHIDAVVAKLGHE